MDERQIVWDEDKGNQNKLEHRISFETAQYIFADPERLERIDRSEGNIRQEERWQSLGKIDGKIYFVVYADETGNTRLISARLAEKHERRTYNGYYTVDNQGWTKAN